MSQTNKKKPTWNPLTWDEETTEQLAVFDRPIQAERDPLPRENPRLHALLPAPTKRGFTSLGKISSRLGKNRIDFTNVPERQVDDPEKESPFLLFPLQSDR